MLRYFAFLTPVAAFSVLKRPTTCLYSSVATEPTIRAQPWTQTESYGAAEEARYWGFAYGGIDEDQACKSYVISDIEGQIPSELHGGTLYKVGPAKFQRGDQKYEHVLDGDGFCAAISFEDATTARYTGRFVETEYFEAEQERDEVLYRNVFGTQRAGGPLANAGDIVLKNVANTAILKWNERLFVLWEAGRPYELDPVTLETLPFTNSGPLANMECRMRGVTTGNDIVDRIMGAGRSFTAHPHIRNDTLVAFTSANNVQTDEASLKFTEYDSKWQVIQSLKYGQRGPPPHDFCLATDHYVFFQNPYGKMDTLPYIMGQKAPTQVMQLLLQQTPTKLHIVPRNGDEAVVVDVPPYFNIHNVAESFESVNENGDRIMTVYSNGWDLQDERYFPKNQPSVPFLGAWGGSYPDFCDKDIVPPALLYRTTVNIDKGTLVDHSEVFPGTVVEFPTQDPRDKHIIYYSLATRDAESLPSVGLCRIDTADDSIDEWWAPLGTFTGECSAVAKEDAPGSWLVTMLYDTDKRKTRVAVFDSENVQQGPICRLNLNHHVTYGLHGFFTT